MLNYDFTPLLRSSVGFEDLMRLAEDALRSVDATVAYPAYDIQKVGENEYRITVAVAGFDRDELSVEARDGVLTVSGERNRKEEESTYLHRGIEGGNFRLDFRLADHVKVLDATLDNGLLHIDLVRELPEAVKPRRIEIATGRPGSLAERAKKLVKAARKAA